MNKKPFYITTPIYYSSGKLHLGHCYTTVVCDAIARYHTMRGKEVYFLTGADEHGQKVEQGASKVGKTPQQYVDDLCKLSQDLWRALKIDYSKYIRTTDDYHMSAVQKIFQILFEQGDIYKGTYEGLYCVPCEAFWTKTQAKDNICPDCGREVAVASEECYFFRLSKYSQKLKELIGNTEFLNPKSRRQEMLNFIDSGLSDLAVTRTKINWGVPVSFDPAHKIYVWIDALNNYITALGAYSEDTSLLDKFWPADLQVVGKEIMRFHAIIWPAILMALGLELPKNLFAHGWILFDGDKMSKSKGNSIDPYILIGRYGLDAVRYFLLAEVVFGTDGLYTDEIFLRKINTDLVNDYGNLLSRTTAMSQQYFGGKVQKTTDLQDIDQEFVQKICDLPQLVDTLVNDCKTDKAIGEIMSTIALANKYIDLTMPWKLAKEQESQSRLQCVLYNLLEGLRVCSYLLTPFLLELPQKALEALGCPSTIEYDQIAYGTHATFTTTKSGALMPRLDIQKEKEFLKQARDAD